MLVATPTTACSAHSAVKLGPEVVPEYVCVWVADPTWLWFVCDPKPLGLAVLEPPVISDPCIYVPIRFGSVTESPALGPVNQVVVCPLHSAHPVGMLPLWDHQATIVPYGHKAWATVVASN
jgi:hypothetical protein